MTLMEVVIAIAVLVFVIPLILAAIGSASSSRLTAEADTRSAWIARQVQREVLAKWALPAQESVINKALNFPAFASESSPEILAYDASGNFISMGTTQDITSSSKIPKAAYIITIYAEKCTPPNLTSIPDSLSILRICILHPAKGSKGSRSVFHYNLISPRNGIL